MANKSILAAFERMWQHVVAALGSKSDSNHTHTASDIGALGNTGTQTLTNGSFNIADQNNSGYNFGISRTVDSTDYKVLMQPTDYVGNLYYYQGSTLANAMQLYPTYTSFRRPVAVAAGGTGANTPAAARTNLGAAPSGYGLGDVAQLIAYTDLNSTKANGWYKLALSSTTTIDGITFQHALVQVIAFDSNASIQIMYPLFQDGKALMRLCEGGTWKEWRSFQRATNTTRMALGVEYVSSEYWNNIPVYTKMLAFSPSSFTDNAITLPHEISGLVRGVSIDVLWKYVDTSGVTTWRNFPVAYYASDDWDGQAFFYGADRIKFELGNTLLNKIKASNDNIYVTLKYTKA